MAARYDCMIVNWKGMFKTVQHSTVFMKWNRGFSSNCTRNIHRPSTPEKEVNWKENTTRKIAKRRKIATDWKVYACSDIDLGQESFEHDWSPFLWWNFLRFSWPLNIFVHNTVFKSWNLGFPATAPVIFIGLLRLKKWSTEKKHRKKDRDRFESLRLLRYRSWRSSIPLRNVLQPKNRDLSSKIYCVSFGGIS